MILICRYAQLDNRSLFDRDERDSTSFPPGCVCSVPRLHANDATQHKLLLLSFSGFLCDNHSHFGLVMPSIVVCPFLARGDYGSPSKKLFTDIIHADLDNSIPVLNLTVGCHGFPLMGCYCFHISPRGGRKSVPFSRQSPPSPLTLAHRCFYI